MTNALIETYAVEPQAMTVAVKDCIDIAGRPTRNGCRAFADAPPAQGHAAVVQSLVDNGFAVVGKAAMHELAYGVTGINEWTGVVDNPLYPGLIAGGSSSGSAAAVAAGQAELALGTDTGGSVRMPAACCGVIGFKPSFGRLSRAGVSPATTTLDCVGLFAREMDPIERAMRAMDPGFADVAPPASPRIALVNVDADAEIGTSVASAVAGAASAVDRVELPLLGAAFRAGVVRMAAEAHAAYGHLVETGLLGNDVEQRLRAAPNLATTDNIAEAERVRIAFAEALDVIFDEYDVLALPTLPAFPPPIAELGSPEALLQLTALVRPFNLSGHPAISLPLVTPSARPAALQLVARRGDDARLCAVARHFLSRIRSFGKEHV